MVEEIGGGKPFFSSQADALPSHWRMASLSTSKGGDSWRDISSVSNETMETEQRGPGSALEKQAWQFRRQRRRRNATRQA